MINKGFCFFREKLKDKKDGGVCARAHVKTFVMAIFDTLVLSPETKKNRAFCG